MALFCSLQSLSVSRLPSAIPDLQMDPIKCNVLASEGADYKYKEVLRYICGNSLISVVYKVVRYYSDSRNEALLSMVLSSNPYVQAMISLGI